MKPRCLDVVLHGEPWLQDHAFAGQAVLPAVESMALLATTVKQQWPATDITAMERAMFPRFFALPDKISRLPFVVELEKIGAMVQADLYSRQATGKFSRLVRHASLVFGAETSLPSISASSPVPDDTLTLGGQTVYDELIPFGPAYRHLDSVTIAFNRCTALLHTPPLPVTCHELGSPFLLDSALHAACVWGQRFAGFVPLPVGFRSRLVIRPSRPNTTYQALVIPVDRQENELIFDMDIREMSGESVERLRGVRMRDVSGGTLSPPAWIRTKKQ